MTTFPARCGIYSPRKPRTVRSFTGRSGIFKSVTVTTFRHGAGKYEESMVLRVFV
nr:MAG TPA: hypothetical protein [Caudoviricetes sp.]